MTVEYPQCPQCRGALVWAGDRYRCERCGRDFQQHAACPDCGKEVQVLKACGAVDYFCTHGHGLISKKRLRFSYTAF